MFAFGGLFRKGLTFMLMHACTQTYTYRDDSREYPPLNSPSQVWVCTLQGVLGCLTVCWEGEKKLVGGWLALVEIRSFIFYFTALSARANITLGHSCESTRRPSSQSTSSACAAKTKPANYRLYDDDGDADLVLCGV